MATALFITTKDNIANNSKVKYIHTLLNNKGINYSKLGFEVVIYALDVNILTISNGSAAFKYS